MALTFVRLQELIKNEGLVFFVAPDREVLQIRVRGQNGVYTVNAQISAEGGVFQLRTIDYLSCNAAHKNLPVVLKALADINFRRRFVKFGWDQSDGEVMAYTDCWVVDSDLTQQQMHQMIGTFMVTMDVMYDRLKKALETGVDAGDPGLQAAGPAPAASSPAAPLPAATPPTPPPALPPALKSLLDRLKGSDSSAAPAPAAPPIEEI